MSYEAVQKEFIEKSNELKVEGLDWLSCLSESDKIHEIAKISFTMVSLQDVPDQNQIPFPKLDAGEIKNLYRLAMLGLASLMKEPPNVPIRPNPSNN